MKLSRPLVILDLETTGTWKEKDKIVEIGMVKLLSEGSKETYLKRVNPGIPIPPQVSAIINITDEDVKDAPPFREIAKDVLEFIGDTDIGGFNVGRFDIPLLERELANANLKLNMKNRTVYDAQKIYHIHEKRDLTAAYEFYCKKELLCAHTALGDVEATLEILDAQIHKYGTEEEGIESLRDFDYEPRQGNFDKEGKFRWWNGELYPTFGKHGRRKSIRQLAGTEQDYLQWILDSDFSDEVKDMVKEALNGRFPESPK
ncbi:exonuclease domain-containing protein [Candidatus Omnitrophota bacterium]